MYQSERASLLAFCLCVPQQPSNHSNPSHHITQAWLYNFKSLEHSLLRMYTSIWNRVVCKGGLHLLKQFPSFEAHAYYNRDVSVFYLRICLHFTSLHSKLFQGGTSKAKTKCTWPGNLPPNSPPQVWLTLPFYWSNVWTGRTLKHL